MRTRRPRHPRSESSPHVNPHAAGLDIGSDEIWACVPEDRDAEPVRSFGTFTPDLYALADWLAACRIETVAMESTGVYWIPVYEILEARGFRVYLVNARHLKHVPGRKSDVKDCQWIQYLHTCGLLSGSFRPDAEMCAVRAYLRHRAALLEYRAAHIQHMQKALHQMNVQLTQVLTDITGTTGLAIIRAIVAGERDPVQLARFRAACCASSTEEIAKALTGHDQPEHVFALKQALALYDVYTEQLRECDADIERRFQAIKPAWPDELPPLNRRTRAAPTTRMPPPMMPAHAVSADGRGSGRHPRPECQHRANDPLRNWPGPAEVAQRESVLFLAGIGPSSRDLRGQGLAPEHAEDLQSRRPSLPAGGASGQSQPQWLGGLLSAYAGPPRSQSRHRRHRP